MLKALNVLFQLRVAFAFHPTSLLQQPTPFSALRMASSSSNVLSVSSPQLLEFREPRTNVTVVLVGAMHYNPTSVRLAQDTVEDLGMSDRLGSVVIESCDIRWNKTGELYEESPTLKKFLSNEMRSACDTAIKYGRPVVLGDQRINITSSAVKEGLKETFADLVNPVNGWGRFYEKVSEAVDVALPTGKGYLNAFGFLEPRLLLAAPVSFIKYPLAFLYRSPLLTTIFLTLIASSSIEPDPLTAADSLELKDLLVSLGVSVLETVVFFRLLTKEILADRNEILAKNILNQCMLYSKNNKQGSIPNLFGLRLPFLNNASNNLDDTEIVYADDKMALGNLPSKNFIVTGKDEEKVVVAVLGMAHCNGIMKLLKEQLV